MQLITREQIEIIYRELRKKMWEVEAGSIEDERLDAQLCLLEELLIQLDNTLL